MRIDAFEIVDLLAEIGGENRGTMDQGPRRNVRKPDTADGNADAREQRELALEHQEIAGNQQHRVADVEIRASSDAELPGRGTADQEGEQVAVGIAPAF